MDGGSVISEEDASSFMSEWGGVCVWRKVKNVNKKKVLNFFFFFFFIFC